MAPLFDGSMRDPEADREERFAIELHDKIRTAVEAYVAVGGSDEAEQFMLGARIFQILARRCDDDTHYCASMAEHYDNDEGNHA